MSIKEIWKDWRDAGFLGVMRELLGLAGLLLFLFALVFGIAWLESL